MENRSGKGIIASLHSKTHAETFNYELKREDFDLKLKLKLELELKLDFELTLNYRCVQTMTYNLQKRAILKGVGTAILRRYGMPHSGRTPLVCSSPAWNLWCSKLLVHSENPRILVTSTGT